ncbi:unnamed protein product, partial [Mesorhabditis belari]|uniref:Angio-associated migratory cell protein n=1 Tax=Mesorhabditis belari TaxID=2138241 RepID=A0AAF3FMR3_9BILA
MDENISDSEEIGDNVDVVFEDDENGTHEEPNMDGDDGVDESEGKIIEDDSTSALYAHEKDVFCVEASGTRWIGSGGEDDMAHIWDLSASPTDPVLSIQHNDSVVSIAFNSTGTLVATGDMSGRIFITQLSDLSKRSEISDCSDIEWMFWHKSSDILFVGDSDGSAWMWLISQTGIAQQKVYSSGNATTSSGLLLPDGRRLLVGYDDGTLKLWQLQNQTNSGITCDSAVLSIAHSETQPLAAVGTANGTVYLLNSTVDANLRALKTFATSDPSQAEDMETEETERSVECLTFAKNIHG